MARISTYNLDGTISDTDKLIGTDSSNTNTKNFRIQDLKEFIYSEISGNMSIAADGTASVATSNVALGVNSGNYVASITGGVGVDSTAATSGAVTNHTLSLDLSELSTVTSISTGNNVAISSSNAGNLITVDNLFIKSPKLVSEAAVANGDYMLFLDGGATGDMKKESLSDISTLFAGAGLVSSSSIINLDLNSLSAKSSIVQGDSLIIVDSEDSNSNKKVTYAILEDEVYSNISGDVTINSSGVSAIGTDKVKGTMLHTSAADTTTLELSSDTLSVLKVPNALTAGDGLASGGTFDGANARTFSLDLNELTGATIANGDSIPFIDATDNTTKKEELSDIVALLAGDALAASNSVLSVGVDDSTIEINSDALRVKANGITNSHINKTAITSQTDLGDAFADADTILLHDATASALREGTMAHLASYVNGVYNLRTGLAALESASGTDDEDIVVGVDSGDTIRFAGKIKVDGISTLTGNTTVTGSMTANGLAFPANSAGSNGQVLTKTSDGTIGFSASTATSVNDTSSTSHLPIVLHDGSNNLLDDDNGLTFQASTGLLKVNKLSPQSNAAGDIGSSTVAYNDLFLSNGGVIEFIQGTGNRVQLIHIDNGAESNGTRRDGSLRLSATSKLEFNDGSQFINAPTSTKLNIVANSVSSGPVGVEVQGEVQIDANLLLDINAATTDISGILIVGGNTTVGGTLTLDSVGVSAVQTSSESFADNNTSLMTSAAIDDRINSAQSMGSGFILEDADGTELSITENKEVKFIGSGGLTINWTDTDNGTDSDPYDLTFTIGTLNQSTTGSAATLTTARNFSLTGNVTASAVSFDGSGNVALSTSLAANTVDSSELVDGSIDTSHIGNDQVTGAKIADDTIDSNHYAAGSIDNEHLAANSVNSSNYVDGSIDTVHIGDDQVTYAKIQNVANDERILGRVSGANGVIEELTKSQVLTMINVADGAQVNAVTSIVAGGGIDVSAATGAVTVTAEGAATDNPGIVELATTAETTTGTDTTRAVTANGLKDATHVFNELITAPSFTSRSTSPVLLLNNSDTTIEDTDVIGEIKFQASSEASGGIADDVIASIEAVAGSNDFSSSVNRTTLNFKVANNGTVSTLLQLFGQGTLTMAGNIQASAALIGATLDISGNADIDGNLTGVNAITASSTVTASNFIVSSDRRLKSEIEPIKEGLEVIKQFTSYNYIKGGEKESGFIAQEVQEVIPHTVYEDKEGMLSMSDRGVVAHMHKAILELEKRLISIEEKLK